MTGGDVPLGMRLKGQAGWNQTEADWRRFLALQPDGCFVAELRGEPVGTVTTCLFGGEEAPLVGWIGMALVDESARDRGVGTELTGRALEYLDRRGAVSIRLDATPMGQSIYEKLGFVADYEIARFEGVLPETDASDGTVAIDENNVDLIARLDRLATGTDRHKLLERLWRERPGDARVFERDNEMLGYTMARAGEWATQIGPCVALAPEAGAALLDNAHRRYVGHAVFIDVPLDNAPAVEWATGAGLKSQRRLLRMTRGKKTTERVGRVWASSGPEKG